MAVAVQDAHGQLQSTDAIVADIKRRIEQAKLARRPREATVLSNLAFAAGQMWLVWDENAKQLVERRRVDSSYANRDLFTANRIREYLNAQMGELSAGDDRPELATAQDGDEPEQIAKHLNHSVEHAWTHDWNADTALRRARGYTLTMGVSAIRVRRDKSHGKVVGHAVYGTDGNAVTDPEHLAQLEQTGQLPDGSLPKFQPVNEGRTCWEPLTFFHVLMQPGITHEDDASWFDIVRPYPIDSLVDEYGDAARHLVEDGDIASAAGHATGTNQSIPGDDRNRLRGHVWLHTFYEKPCRRYPQGRVTVLASNNYVLLDVQEQLDYQLPDETPHTGVVFLHWNRLDDSFYSQAFVEPLKDPQRTINELKTAQLEITWRGMPKVFTKEGDLINNPTGLPLENIELNRDAAQPAFFAGIGPGPWMGQLIADCDNDLSHASTLSALKLGENPQNVDTYSQLALLQEQEGYKRSSIIGDHQQQIGTLVKIGVFDIRRYWPDQKQLMVGGQEDGVYAAETFVKSRLPVFFQVKMSSGNPLPRSQAAELKKIDAVWAAAVQCGVAVQNPAGWIAWYNDSVSAGEVLDLPEVETHSQERMARFENQLMLAGQTVEPAQYDLAPVHIPIHREAEDEARARGDFEAVARIEAHVQATVHLQQVNAAQVAAAQQTPSPAGQLASAAGGASPVFAAPDFAQLASGN
jgi:hypothetical protein